MKGTRRAALAIALLGGLAAFVPAVGAAGDEPGARVSGVVTEAGSGSPIVNLRVCVEAVAPGAEEICDATDSNGAYAIAGIPPGTYLVAFGVETLPGTGRTAAQWWNGVSSRAQATPIAMTPPQIFTGINGQIGKGELGPNAHTGGGTIVVPGPQAPPPAELTPQRCKKGYRWRKIHGVKRCVPKPKHHHGHPRGTVG
jgi:hypothetical protein